MSNRFLQHKSLSLFLSGALAVACLATPGSLGAHELGTAHSHAEHYLFVPDCLSSEVVVIDTERDRVIARLPVGRVPHQVVAAEEAGKLEASSTEDNTSQFETTAFVTSQSDDEARVIDTRTQKLIKLIDGVGEESWGATMAGAINYCH
ncbi:MAG: hypothetical protein AAF495_20130 [Pseudomonadota bacterium]